MTLVNAVEQSVQQQLALNFSGQSLATIYVACSGGRDSMALLAVCQSLALPIHVIHVNHQLQAASDYWQQRVVQFCTQRHIACTALTIDWASYGIDAQQVDEQLARHARYQAIADTVETNAIIALAHHADDQAETLLLNLCQGAGVDGLSAMQPLSQQLEFGKRLWLWRPLLGVSREAITAFVQQQGISYVDDPTNIGEHNRRAWLRHAIMPTLKQNFPALLENLGRSAQNLSEAKTIIDTQSAIDLQHCQLDPGWTVAQQRLDIQAVRQLSQARAFAMLRRWLKGDEKFAPSRQWVKQVYTLIHQQAPSPQTQLQWQGIVIRRYQQTLYRLDNNYQALCAWLNQAERVCQHLNTQCQQMPLGKIMDQQAMMLSVRRVLPNEALQRLGVSYHEPFKKLCQRHHIPSWERPWAWVVLLSSADGTMTHLPIALLLPSLSLWLVEAAKLGMTSQPCPWHLLPDEQGFNAVLSIDPSDASHL